MATSRTRSGASFKPPEPAILPNIAAPVMRDHPTHGPSESFGTFIRPHMSQKPATSVIGSAMTPGRTHPEVHFQPKTADSAVFLVQKGILAPIEEASDSSNSDSEEVTRRHEVFLVISKRLLDVWVIITVVDEIASIRRYFFVAFNAFTVPFFVNTGSNASKPHFPNVPAPDICAAKNVGRFGHNSEVGM